jgi:hypothetical protein
VSKQGPNSTGPLHEISGVEAACLSVVFTLLSVYVSRAIWDIDVFWHIAAGRAIVEAGAIPTTDIFSATDPSRTWITFQWGYEVITYWLDSLGGLALVKAAHAFTMLMGFGAFWFVCRRHYRLDGALSFLLLTLLIVLFEDRIRCRPHVVNLVAWVGLCPWLLAGGVLRDPRRTWPIMGVSVFLWANLHAGGALLFLIAASTVPVGRSLSGLGGWGQRRPAKIRHAWIGFSVMLGGALLAPNFVQGNVQALTMLKATESAIGEWLPAWHFFRIGNTPGHFLCGAIPMLLCLAWVATAVAASRDKCQRTPPWVLLLGLSICVLSQRSVRFVWIATIGLMVLWPHVPRPRLSPAARRRTLIAMSAALVAVSIQFNIYAQHGGWTNTVSQAFIGSPVEEQRFPTAHTEFLKKTGFEGGIFCQGNWGGYLLWKLWPKARVLADGRGNYSKDVTDALDTTYDRARFAEDAFGETLEEIYGRYDIDAIVHQHPVWPPGYQVNPAMWVRVFTDSRGAIWIRNTERGRAYLDRLKTRQASPKPSPE